MKAIWSSALVGAALLCFGCTPGQQFLQPDVVRALGSGPISIIYIDPIRPVTVLRYHTGDANAYGGGAAGEIVAEVNKNAGANNFEGYLALHADDIAKLDLVDRGYAAMHVALSSIPALQRATWQRLSLSDPDPSTGDLAEKAGTEIVIIIQPQVMIYANVDTLTIRTRVRIYQQSRGHSAVARVAESLMDAAAPLGPDGSDSLPNPLVYDQYLVKGPELEQRVTALFADDGAEFQQAYAQALAELKPEYTTYFAGMEAKR